MQFIENGPDIPERLLEAHEEGKVVFFCGAGISYPAGLPGFGSLVNKIYDEVGHSPNAVQKSAIESKQYDTAIGLLEDDHIDKREGVRQVLANILTPDYSKSNSKSTHKALLTLSKARNGNHHLVTTNFDRIFEDVKVQDSLDIPIYAAPLLPVPKNRLNGLVYLHGLIPETPTKNELDNLVISSGDFGLAYLNERWAARFVSEMFRNYTVCFIGYSLEDPVLRYMMDALAADRLLGESPPEMFAFGSYSKNQREKNDNEWKAKNVTPILYAMKHNHYNLHHTLREWANTYRDGINGKEKIILKYALSMPVASTIEDDFIGRVLWSLSDKTGLSAKLFSELDPSPPLEWLEEFEKNNFYATDLNRFNITPDKDHDDDFEFSLIKRPTPYKTSRYMSFLNYTTYNHWDQVMLYLAQWLLKYINDPKLILWIANNGNTLDTRFYDLINRALLNRNDISPLMLTLWNVIFNGNLKGDHNSFDFYRWTDNLKIRGLSHTLKAQLRDILKPKLKIRKSFYSEYRDNNTPDSEEKDIKKILEWEIGLNADYLASSIKNIKDEAYWVEVLPELLNEFNHLLLDTYELMNELGDVDDQKDFSYIHQASIIPNPQNSNFQSWTVLIELTRDAWIQMVDKDISIAQSVAESWIKTPYPLFKRLAYFAATYVEVINPTKAVEWLLLDNAYWLWSGITKREVMRLLVSIAPLLEQTDLTRLEHTILSYQDESLLRTDLSGEQLLQIKDYAIWLRLSKLQRSGAILGDEASSKLNELCIDNPVWDFSEDQQEEFSVFTGSGSGSKFSKMNYAPKELSALVDWIKDNPETDHWGNDDWQELCKNDFRLTSQALYKLHEENFWPKQRWDDAIYAWSSSNKLLRTSWLYVNIFSMILSEDRIIGLSNSLGLWLKAQAEILTTKEDTFLSLVTKVLELQYDIEDDVDQDVIMEAINHPIGFATQALTTYYFRNDLKDNQDIPDTFKNIFIKMLLYSYGRVLIARHLITFLRVDESWTTEHLIPLFDWNNSETHAKEVWLGFLGAPRLYAPLLRIMKQSFLDTSLHYNNLGSEASQYAGLLTYAALEYNDVFSKEELVNATNNLPEDGLTEVIKTLTQSIKHEKAEQTREYVQNRVLPYLKKYWPKSITHKTKDISKDIALLIIESNDEFPNVFNKMKSWLDSIEYPYYHLSRVIDNQLHTKFGKDILEFLNIIINNIGHDRDNLLTILDTLENTQSDNENFIQLKNKLQLTI